MLVKYRVKVIQLVILKTNVIPNIKFVKTRK